jgi:hypothetical protein
MTPPTIHTFQNGHDFKEYLDQFVAPHINPLPVFVRNTDGSVLELTATFKGVAYFSARYVVRPTENYDVVAAFESDKRYAVFQGTVYPQRITPKSSRF